MKRILLFAVLALASCGRDNSKPAPKKAPAVAAETVAPPAASPAPAPEAATTPTSPAPTASPDPVRYVVLPENPTPTTTPTPSPVPLRREYQVSSDNTFDQSAMDSFMKNVSYKIWVDLVESESTWQINLTATIIDKLTVPSVTTPLNVTLNVDKSEAWNGTFWIPVTDKSYTLFGQTGCWVFEFYPNNAPAIWYAHIKFSTECQPWSNLWANESPGLYSRLVSDSTQQ